MAETGAGERNWSFTPDNPWTTGEHRLVVEPRLEDVAGNSPARVFDRDVTKAEDAPGEWEAVEVSFVCAGPASVHLSSQECSRPNIPHTR